MSSTVVVYISVFFLSISISKYSFIVYGLNLISKDNIQTTVANFLGMKASSCLDIEVKQLGGGFGGKYTRASIVATAAALGTMHTQKPVKVSLDFKTNMEMLGKRCPWQIDYEIGFDNEGLLLGVDYTWFIDDGYLPDGTIVLDFRGHWPYFDNVYFCKNWDTEVVRVKTNTPVNTTVRAPDYLSTISSIELILDHVARHLHVDPIEIRSRNMYKKGQMTPIGQYLPHFNVDEIIDKLVVSSDYKSRVASVNDFNMKNRWKKRGIYLTPLRYSCSLNLGYYNALLSIYNVDGSVAVSHGGIEMGQGIHTKVAQLVAHELSIDMDLISMKATNNLVNPNGQFTAASVTTELICEAMLECCNMIKANLEPVRKLMPEAYTWKQLIAKAFSMRVDLCARYWLRPKPNQFGPDYDAHGAACTEVLVDVLTGETEICRTDIMYDCGESMNGMIDVGQAEGAFVFGLGFWFQEQFAYDETNGRPYMNHSGQYTIPTSKDIPMDFRVSLLRDNPNIANKMRTKFISEQPLLLAVSAALAVKNAILSARHDSGCLDDFEISSPLTVETIQHLALVDHADFRVA